MKEITRIHLAATPYNIEVAAKKELEKYIQGIERALATDDDTLREIEARMIEILAERGVKGETVITMANVTMLKERLGAPGEFIDEPQQLVSSDKKRLMRDEQGGMAAGVLAGIAAYTNVDVVWYRIVAIVLAIASFGTALLVYLVLWIAIPPARTAAERLQMRGRAATLESIQAESASELRAATPSHKKPLVLILRALGILTLLGIVFSALAIVAAAIFAGLPLLSVTDWMTNGWLIAALLVGSLSGVLLAALAGIGIYMLAAWRSSKTLVIVSGIITVAGLVAFGTSGGLAVYGAQEMKTTVDEHTTTRREDLGELKGANSLRIAKTYTPVTYKVSTDEPYAEITTFQRDTKMRVPLKITRDGEAAVLEVGELPKEECKNWIDTCTFEHAYVTVYGPTLASLDVADTKTAYEASGTQDSLTLITEGEIRLAGRINTLDANLKGGILDADNAAIDDVKLAVDDNSVAEMGVVRTLSIRAPSSCGADGKSRVGYERAASLMVNESPASATSMACVELDNQEAHSSPEA